MRVAKNNRDSDAKMIFSQLSTYYALFVTFIGLIISLYSEDIIILLTTPDYYRSADFAPVIVMSFVLRGGYYLFVAKIFYVKKAIKLLALVSVISAVVDVVLNILLVPRFGMAGSSFAFIISSLLLVLLTYYFSQKAYYIKYERIRLLKIIIAAIVVLLLYYFLSDVFQRYYLKLAIKTIVLLFFLLYFRYSCFFRKSEMDNLNDVVLKVKAKYFKK
ncbi:MAG: polysaccharide biosynthesis C-terminal domain-containing protein [Bacteroidales bacterium]|nr:polysaccharide biosynthesis C-terminal domain-containing protein [Bacteroidales bacterium]